MTRAEREELRRLLAEATPLPWRAGEDEDEYGDAMHVVWLGRKLAAGLSFTTDAGAEEQAKNAQLIVAMREHLPSLLDAADRADELDEEVGALMDKQQDLFGRLAACEASAERARLGAEAENSALRARVECSLSQNTVAAQMRAEAERDRLREEVERLTNDLRFDARLRCETDRADRLQAEVERLRALVERYQAASDGDALERQYPRVKEELERLRRLAMFATHRIGCRWSTFDEGPCTCGYDAARKP